MTCSKCGASNPTIHLSQIMNGIQSRKNYCENCAPEEMKNRPQDFRNGTFDPKAEWLALWEKLHAAHPEFSTEAYSFVKESMSRDALDRIDPPKQSSRSISAVLESCQAYAKELYGSSAKSKLKSWGIETFLDVGEIIILTNSRVGMGQLDSALEKQLENIHKKMQESLREKYGQSPFLPDGNDKKI